MGKLYTMHMDCPKCGFAARARLPYNKASFLLYRCPSCQCNVVLYDNKVDILSDHLVRLLMGSKNMRTFGSLETNQRVGITDEYLNSLKKLLNSEKDSAEIISQL